MHTLILYANYSSTASYYDDWYDAFFNDPFFTIEECDICKYSKNRLIQQIKSSELIILLHSTNADNLKYLKDITPLLNERTNRLVTFVGNEVNISGSSMQERISILKQLEPDYIFTQLLEETGKWLYQECTRSTVLSIPHALNVKSFFPKKNIDSRSIDIGVRSFKYGIHLGDQERNVFLDTINQYALQNVLTCDISFDPNKRFTRNQWADFLNECKATIATEAGTYYLQKDDAMVNEIQNFLTLIREESGGLTIQKTSYIYLSYHILPKRLKDLIKYLYYAYSEKLNIKFEHLISDDQMFQEVFEKIIGKYEKCPFYSKAISSRHFDAVGTKTALIMLEGRYNDILVPDEHYIEIKNDHSNMVTQLEKLKDITYLEKMTTNTLEYVLDCHQHSHRINLIQKLLLS